MIRPTRSAPLALLGAVTAAEAAVLLLRGREAAIVPARVQPQAYFSADDVRRARAYRRPQLALTLLDSALAASLLARLARRPPAALGRVARRSDALGAAGSGVALSLGLSAAGLPLGAIAHVRAVRAGLSTQSWRGWWADLARSTAITTPLAGAGGVLLAELKHRWPQRWWLPGAAAAVGVSAGFAVAGPVLLDPVFNSFTPLPEGQLRDDVLELARRAGVRVGEVFEVDASRRTTAANAYVTGLGPTKRVVLFDTLLKSFSAAETRLVVAHELAHVRHRDVQRGLVLMALMAAPLLRAIQLLGERIAVRGAAADAGRVGTTEPTAAETLPAVVLAAAAASLAVGPVASQLSRAIERRADAFALELTRDPEPFIGFERRIVAQNLADPAPPRWLTALTASHPPAIERVGAAVAFAQREGIALEPPADLPADG